MRATRQPPTAPAARRPAGLIAGALSFAGALFAAPALAGMGQPSDWQMNMQGAATPIMEEMVSFHNLLLVIITAISVFVLALLVWVAYRYNAARNPTPSKTTHNTLIEVAWTVVPVLILVVIAIPSFRLLRDQEVIPPADVTIKITGYQWYWGAEYPQDGSGPGTGGFKFEQNMLKEAEVPADQKRLYLLAVDNPIVLPVNKVVRVQVTAADVIHNYAIPSFGIRRDAVPGRLNETWFKATREGDYYGQCSRLCGSAHAFMPSHIRIVSEAAYAAWLAEGKQKFAAIEPARPTQVAATQVAPTQVAAAQPAN